MHHYCLVYQVEPWWPWGPICSTSTVESQTCFTWSAGPGQEQCTFTTLAVCSSVCLLFPGISWQIFKSRARLHYLSPCRPSFFRNVLAPTAGASVETIPCCCGVKAWFCERGQACQCAGPTRRVFSVAEGVEMSQGKNSGEREGRRDDYHLLCHRHTGMQYSET